MREQLGSHGPKRCRIILAAAAMLALTGCAGSSVSTASVTGNEQGGKVPYTEGGIQSAMDAAQAHCRQFGKKGQIIQMTPSPEGGGLIGFQCR
ncbi:MAG TPA: hypothetical protein VH678_01660 [Xanthobacteraceae bacterium]|jgi:hypothetical protein